MGKRTLKSSRIAHLVTLTETALFVRFESKFFCYLEKETAILTLFYNEKTIKFNISKRKHVFSVLKEKLHRQVASVDTEEPLL